MGHSFWTACREMRTNAPTGWTFDRWPKTESSFTLKSPKCFIEIENGVDVFKRNNPDLVSVEMKKRFEIRVYTPEADGREAEIKTALPDELKDVLFLVTKKLYEQFPFRIEDVPRNKYRMVVKNEPPGEPEKAKIEFPVGSFVRIVSGPYPKLMKDSVQRIDARKPGEAQVTRWYSRKDKRVSAWVPLENMELVGDHEELKDNCLRYAANTSGSAPEMFERGHCSYCTAKPVCSWYQREKK